MKYQLNMLLNLLLIGLILFCSIWQFNVLPFGDLLLHEYMANVMANIQTFSNDYEITLMIYPNMLWQIIHASFLYCFGEEFGTHILLTIHLMISTLGLYLLLRYFVPTVKWFYISICLILQFNYFFQMGYLQYCLTLSLIPWFLILWIKIEDRLFIRTIIFFLASIAFFFMHFVGYVTLCCSILLLEVYQNSYKNILINRWKQCLTYLPGLIACFTLICFIPEFDNDGRLLYYSIARKLSNLYLILFRPLPIFSLPFIASCIILLVWFIKNKKRNTPLISKKWIRVFLTCIAMYLAMPYMIKLLADADLRILNLLIIFIVFTAIAILEKFYTNKQTRNKGLQITLISIFISIPLFYFYSNLKEVESDLVSIMEHIPDNEYPLMVNHDPSSNINRFFLPTGYTLYCYIAFEKLKVADTPYKQETPFIFETSILRPTYNKPYGDRKDYYLFPWGGNPVPKEVIKEKNRITNMGYVLFPISGINDYQWITNGRKVIMGKHWVLAILPISE